MDYFRYTLWPAIKVKLLYWWWIVKYGGKKNIPPELIFNQLEKNLKKMMENLEQAYTVGRDTMSREELIEYGEMMSKAKDFKENCEKLPKNKL